LANGRVAYFGEREEANTFFKGFVKKNRNFDKHGKMHIFKVKTHKKFNKMMVIDLKMKSLIKKM
jgi:hypothetical protein